MPLQNSQTAGLSLGQQFSKRIKSIEFVSSEQTFFKRNLGTRKFVFCTGGDGKRIMLNMGGWMEYKAVACSRERCG